MALSGVRISWLIWSGNAGCPADGSVVRGDVSGLFGTVMGKSSPYANSTGPENSRRLPCSVEGAALLAAAGEAADQPAQKKGPGARQKPHDGLVHLEGLVVDLQLGQLFFLLPQAGPGLFQGGFGVYVSVRRWYVGLSYSKMFGIAFTGAPISQVIMNLFVKQALAGSEGDAWRDAMQMLGGLTLICLAAAALLARKPPERYGMEPFGGMPGAVGAPQHVWSIRETFTTYPIWGVILTFLTSVLGEFMIWTQAVSYWHTDLGMPLESAAHLYIIIGIVGIFSMPIMGVVADKVVQRSASEASGRKKMLIFGPLTGAAACTLLLMQTPESSILGALSCVVFAIYWAVVPGGVVGYAGAVYGRATLGRIWGLATLIVMGIGPFAGAFIGGYLKDVSGSYTYSIIFALGAFVASMLLASSLPLTTTPEKA